jgi:hypothetical protein
MGYKYLFSIFFYFFVFEGSAQITDNLVFYKHFTGHIDTNMHVSLDLVSDNNKITGFYYYYFSIPGQETIIQYGKTIPLEGFLNGHELSMNDYGDKSSGFTGMIDKKWNIRGNWQRREYENPIKFKLSEDYSNNSLPLSYYALSDKESITTTDKSVKKLPQAKVEISLLYPEKRINKELRDTLDHIITRFMLNQPEKIKSPELLMENIAFSFFQSYREATDGIEGIQHFASFNWEKKLKMGVIYNENNILSLWFEKYGYTGGAHGIMIRDYEVLDMAGNQHLKLNDIFTQGYQLELEILLDKKLRRLNGILHNENLRDAGFLVDNVEVSDNFYINNDGIGFYYNVYQIAPFAAGPTELFIPFAELQNILKPDHTFNWVKN